MRKDLIELDGSEGGGQILRSALSLSMTSGQPLRIRNIRGRRSRPGLLRQHLTAVRAAAEICAAEVEGAELGSRELAFRPGAIRAGDYAFAIGSAGSCSLVLQTLLPALLAANGESRVRISGGTHNPLAPPADFLRDSWLPLLQRMGAEVDLELLRHGFVPAGGGELLARVRPARWRPLQLEHPGAALRRQARALLAGIPGHVGERELERVRQRLGWSDEERQLEFLAEDQGPGNALLLRIDCEHICRDLLRLRPGRRQRRTGGGTGRDASHRLDGKRLRGGRAPRRPIAAAHGPGRRRQLHHAAAERPSAKQPPGYRTLPAGEDRRPGAGRRRSSHRHHIGLTNSSPMPT